MEKAFEMMASHFSLPLHRPGLFKDGPPQLPPSLLYPVGSNDHVMHVNMLLHHFLLKTAALNHQQHVKSLTSPYSMRGYDLFKSGFTNPASVLYHNPSTLHRPQNQAPQSSITSSLLTPPLSERSSSSVESSNEGVSSPTLGKSAILDLRKPTAKETSLKRKTPNKV
ncbi:hypothetical protein EB796_008228 [Bugula neritina]|uniref:Uncharacterized protein n=1 Tax=Bugula neritina TaxID=10212 RepID=A0A7J7K5L1_BUGNE|nr:hypothetical protein EB796_008228 [Bugula neritina]